MKIIVLSFLLFTCNQVNAAATYLGSNPSTWKIENYIGGGVAVWNTGSPCGGLLTFSTAATAGDLNRFWATVTVAKTSGKRMFLRYDDTTNGGCPILSFGLDSE